MQGKKISIDTERCGSRPLESCLFLGDSSQINAERIYRFAGQVQTVYLDPPFFTGRQFKRTLQTDGQDVSIDTYKDNFENMDAYIAMMRRVLRNARMLLTNSGTIFLHVDFRAGARIRLLLDEVFGEKRFVNEIIWAYESGGRATNFFPRKHDTIYFYAKNKAYYFNLKAVPCGTRETEKKNHMTRRLDENGRSYRAIRSAGKEYRYYDDEPVYPSDVWTDISHLQQRDPERAGYETQKPIKLLRRILGAATQDGDVAADLFAGSGTTGVAAAKMGRRFLLCDQEPQAILTADARLSRENCSYTVEAPTVSDHTDLWAEVTADGSTVQLTRFNIPTMVGQETQPVLSGLQAIDHWSVGRVEGTVYSRFAVSFNSTEPLAIPAGLDLSTGLAVMVWDYLGNRRCYRLMQETDS